MGDTNIRALSELCLENVASNIFRLLNSENALQSLPMRVCDLLFQQLAHNRNVTNETLQLFRRFANNNSQKGDEDVEAQVDREERCRFYQMRIRGCRGVTMEGIEYIVEHPLCFLELSDTTMDIRIFHRLLPLKDTLTHLTMENLTLDDNPEPPPHLGAYSNFLELGMLQNLRYLNLKNLKHRIGPIASMLPPSLTHLDLSMTSFEEIKLISHLTLLEELFLSQTQLLFFPLLDERTNTPRFPMLRILDISSNENMILANDPWERSHLMFESLLLFNKLVWLNVSNIYIPSASLATLMKHNTLEFLGCVGSTTDDIDIPASLQIGNIENFENCMRALRYIPPSRSGHNVSLAVLRTFFQGFSERQRNPDAPRLVVKDWMMRNTLECIDTFPTSDMYLITSATLFYLTLI
eukprot:m.41833 g.41833  ORF g.41833 m.41833 type:complete len:409 (+) comp9817_c0_seq1:461-1687(+)